MNNFVQELKETEFTIDNSAEIQIDEQLNNLVSGGVNPEDAETEDTNVICFIFK